MVVDQALQKSKQRQGYTTNTRGLSRKGFDKSRARVVLLPHWEWVKTNVERPAEDAGMEKASMA